MTDPIDHSARTREIEARLEAKYIPPPPFAGIVADHHFRDRQAIADLRYLLDRVRELEDRPCERYESNWYNSGRVLTDYGPPHSPRLAPGCQNCGYSHDAHVGMAVIRGQREAAAKTRLLPAPETVEAQS